MGGCTSQNAVTHLKVVNKTNNSFTVYVSEISDHDWVDRIFRPDYNFHGITIYSGQSVQKQEIVRPSSNCAPFTVTLLFSNGTRDVFRIGQKYAYTPNCNIFEHSVRNHDIFQRNEYPSTLVIEVEHTQEQLINQRAEKLNKQGEEAMRKKLYEIAMEKFRSAAKMANESWTIQAARANLEKAENFHLVEQLKEEGNELIRRKRYDEAMKKIDEGIKVAKEEIQIEDLKGIRNTILEKQENDVAEELNNEGEELMEQNRFSEAAEKFRRAHILANEMSSISKIMKNVHRANDEYYAQILNDEGKELMKKKQYEAAVKKFDEALNFTHEEKMRKLVTDNKDVASNHKRKSDTVKEINSEGRKALEMKQYEAALGKFDQALQLVEEDSLRGIILNNKVETLNQFAKTLYDEGWILENDQNEDKSNEAAEKFERAKHLAETAFTIRKDSLQKTHVDVVKMKIAGNELYNQALSVEKEASQLYETADSYTAAKNKFEEALKVYEEAVKKFEEGVEFDARFGDSVKFTRQQIEDVKKVIGDIKKLELSRNIDKAERDIKKTEEKRQMENDEEVEVVNQI